MKVRQGQQQAKGSEVTSRAGARWAVSRHNGCTWNGGYKGKGGKNPGKGWSERSLGRRCVG